MTREELEQEIARLENIVAIQAKQIELLLIARDAEKLRAEKAEAKISAGEGMEPEDDSGKVS